MGPELLAIVKRGSKRIRPLPPRTIESGRLPRKPRAVLFDVYGTLLARVGKVHPRPAAKRRQLEALIRRYELPTTVAELEAGLQSAIAREHAALRAAGRANPEVSIERIWAGMFSDRSPEDLRQVIVEYELATHPAWPMPGCRRLLQALACRGLTHGIVSNAQFYTPVFLHALLGASLQDLGFSSSLCLYSCDFGVAKPDPALFDHARRRLHELGLREEETVMVGDDPRNDIGPATRSGFMTVLAALDGRSYESTPDGVGSAQPDAVIGHLAALETLVDGFT